MAKRIQISPNGGTNWYTFPGDKGEIHDDATSIKDTTFGQDFQSDQTGMIQWNITTNGLYKGFAGYVAKIKKSGTPTTFTGEATTLLSGRDYQITNPIKQILDRATAVVVHDGVTLLTIGTDYTVDYLFGIVTLTNAPAGAVTVAGKYLPMTQVAKANSFTLTQNANAKKVSVYETAQTNGGYESFDYGLRTVSLALKGIYASSNGFRALLAARAEMIIEVNPDGSSASVARGWFKAMTTGQSGNVGDNEEQSLNFSLAVPFQDDISLPFDWNFSAGSTLARSVKEAIIAWANGTLTKVNYLENGTTGTKGDAVVTDLTLTGGLDAMNEFSIKFQGSDAPTAFP